MCSWVPGVTPCAGVLIETYSCIGGNIVLTQVTPCAGVLIETGDMIPVGARNEGHTLRGCAD